jgi:hypothetical protein
MGELNYSTLKRARMAKFTNKQVELIADSVLAELAEKKRKESDKIKKSDAYVNFDKHLKESDAVYNELYDYHQQIKDKQLQINILKQEQEVIESTGRVFAEKHGINIKTNGYYPRNKSLVDIVNSYRSSALDDKFKDLIFDESKMRKDMETEILFLGESDAQKIRNHLLTKFS